MVFIAPFIFAVALIILVISSKYVLQSAIKLSEGLKISEFGIGFILLAICTSLPEVIVSIISSFYGQGAIAVGTIFGSNIANITLILGSMVLIGGTIYVKKSFTEVIQILFITTLIPVLIFQSGFLTHLQGILLIILFIYFIYISSREKKEKVTKKSIIAKIGTRKLTPHVILFILSVAILLISAHYLIDSASDMINRFLIPGSVIGATIIALGTSLPELVVSLRGLAKKKYDLVIGNLIGSSIINISLVLGIVAVLSGPLPLNMSVFSGIYPFLIVSTLVVWYFISTHRSVNRKEALALFGIYILFILQEVGILSFFL